MSSFESIPGEEWRQVVGFPNYDVSDMGRVRYWYNCRGHRLEQPRLRKTPPNVQGYPEVSLSRDRKCFVRLVHILVLEAFVGPRPTGGRYEARHFPDRTRTNVRLDNLSWGLQEQNTEDKRTHGTLPFGSKHFAAKLDEAKVTVIRERIRRGDRLKDIAADFDVHPVTITDIKVGRSWCHVK